MIQKLIDYKRYLFNKEMKYTLDGNVFMARYYFNCGTECRQLLELFSEMKLSVNEWHRIRELTKEYDKIRSTL